MVIKEAPEADARRQGTAAHTTLLAVSQTPGDGQDRKAPRLRNRPSPLQQRPPSVEYYSPHPQTANTKIRTRDTQAVDLTCVPP